MPPKIRKPKRKVKPRPVINYPPVPTRKWIPPDKRPKSKPKPRYVKPEGISQKLAISSLKKVWHKFNVYEDAAMVTGHFSQVHKRFNYKTNGFQGACNSAIACAYSELYKMFTWTDYLLDEILVKGDELYIRSTQQGDRYLIQVPPEKIYTSFFIGNKKITLYITQNQKLNQELGSSLDKISIIMSEVIEKFLQNHTSGIFYIKEQYAAIWKNEETFYYFDPGEHDDVGNPWNGNPGLGVSLLGKFKTVQNLVEYIIKNFPASKEPYSKFHLIPCGIARIVTVNTAPPQNLEELTKQTELVNKTNQEPGDMLQVEPSPQTEGEEIVEEPELELLEMSPEDDGAVRPLKHDIPIPTYIRGEQTRLSYYTELIPEKMGILRATTCQTDHEFSKYQGRQSMGNALSALIMLRIAKSKYWIPEIVNSILRYGDILYRDAMLSIPRTHSLRLSDFPQKIEYEGRKFTPIIDEYSVIGQLQSQDYDILDLLPALNDFLTDHDCCIVLGPLIWAVWIEEGIYYVFDPNERDSQGKFKRPFHNSTDEADYAKGVACVLWSENLSDLIHLYITNIHTNQKHDRFYLSKVEIVDYLEVSNDWYNFKGINVGIWILRGSFHQGSLRFPEESRNTQGTANALIALAMAVSFDVQEWSSDSLDEILKIGDEFYRASVEALQEKNLFTNPQLMLSELNKHQQLRDKLVEYEIDECVVNGAITIPNPKEKSGLQIGLKEFFADNDYGVVTLRNISLAVWKVKDAFYYCDPYSRDQKGIICGFGTSCVLRFENLNDLALAIETNLDANIEDIFTISKVKITLFDGDVEGVKPPLNQYSALSEYSAILRSWLSTQSMKYEERRGRQVVPMCVYAVGFNKLKPAMEWTKNDMDTILDKGDNLYVETMSDIQEVFNTSLKIEENPPAGETQPVAVVPPTGSKIDDGGYDENDILEESEEEIDLEVRVTSENVKRQVKIGPNDIDIEIFNVAQGNIKTDLKEALTAYFETTVDDEENHMEGLLETKHYTISIWRDDKAYYLFDPLPRDKLGLVIGKDDWNPESVEPSLTEPDIIITDPVEERNIEPSHPSDDEDENEEAEDMSSSKLPDIQFKVEEEALELEEAEDEEEEEEEEELEERPPELFQKIKMSPSFWVEQEKSGRACTIWFTKLNDFVNFIYENIPTRDRSKLDFTLKSVNIGNRLKMKSKYNPEDERPDAYAGNWYDFTEMDHGKWILRASMDITFELFPEANRGKQSLCCSVAALSMAHMFETTSFVKTVPDSIIVYGDKLYTFLKRAKKKQMLNDPNTNLRDDEIDWMLQHEEFTVTDIPKRICISQFMVEFESIPNYITGDTKAQNFEDILDLERGLEKFFEDSTYGILYCRGLYVAIWKGKKMFYMFDGMKRGPNGIISSIGTGCVTRYMEIKELVKVFLENLPVLGTSDYYIHKVTLLRDICPREREPKLATPVPTALQKWAGAKMLIPGKSIIRGSISQEDPIFGKGPNTLSAPIAIVALTMSLIHKPENWSKPIVDDIIILGSELYEDSVNELGFDFNPWEDPLDIYRVKKDFKLGVIKANCELRHTDQRGIIDCKESDTQNLRQGMERFFEENTHGILVTQSFTVALWEQIQDGEPLIYIVDPNPRSATGMPLFSGTGCVLAFINAKMASSHLIGCILDPELKGGEFVIVPVEIVVGSKRTCRKFPEKTPTKSSINVLMKLSQQVAAEQKRKLRKLAEEARKRKESKKRELIGRSGYHVKGGMAILRGYKSQNSIYYDIESRNKQDIPNCISSVVMHSVLSIELWNYQHIDLILDTGDQLYIDSYIAYGPKNPKLGMENILRKFFMSTLEVHVTIYKSIITEMFTPTKLNVVLEAFFQQQSICMLNYSEQWVSIFFKGGYYFVFDPHERDIEGNLVKSDEKGSAVVLRYDSLMSLCIRIINNLGGNTDESETFSLWIMSVESN